MTPIWIMFCEKCTNNVFRDNNSIISCKNIIHNGLDYNSPIVLVHLYMINSLILFYKILYFKCLS